MAELQAAHENPMLLVQMTEDTHNPQEAQTLQAPQAPQEPQAPSQQAIQPAIPLVLNYIAVSKLAPEVPFDNWKHFVDTVYRTKTLFNDALRDAVTLDAALYRTQQTHNNTLHAFRDPIYEDHALRRFQGEAKSIMAQLALGKHNHWTHAVADTLFLRVLRVARVYKDVIVFHHAYDHYDQDNEQGDLLPHTEWPRLFAFNAQHMFDLMKQEVDTAFGGICPWNRSSFENSFISALLDRNFGIVDAQPYLCLSTSEMHAWRLTFATGTHPRVGAQSPLQPLDADICAIIFSSIFMNTRYDKHVLHTLTQWLY